MLNRSDLQMFTYENFVIKNTCFWTKIKNEQGKKIIIDVEIGYFRSKFTILSTKSFLLRLKVAIKIDAEKRGFFDRKWQFYRREVYGMLPVVSRVRSLTSYSS